MYLEDFVLESTLKIEWTFDPFNMSNMSNN